MKAMIFSDLVTSKNAFAQLVALSAFAAVIIGISTGMLVTCVCCIAAMVPFMYLFSISAYDEQNGWERFRLTLPISKPQVAYGRYASMAIIMVATLAISTLLGLVIGVVADVLPAGLAPEELKLSAWGVPTVIGAGAFAQVVILLAASLSLPFIMRFGMTKGSRLVPIVLLVAFCTGAAFFGTSAETADVLAVFGGGESGLAAIGTILGVVAIVLYLASATLSARLYERREL